MTDELSSAVASLQSITAQIHMLADGAENGVIGRDEQLRQVAPLKQQTPAFLERWGGGLADHERAELERLRTLLLLEGD